MQHMPSGMSCHRMMSTCEAACHQGIHANYIKTKQKTNVQKLKRWLEFFSNMKNWFKKFYEFDEIDHR